LAKTLFARIAKTWSALTGGYALYIATQVLLPPLFIHAYGTPGYGTWLVLSASVGMISSLNFGIQTFATNELTMRYHRREMVEYRRLQSTAYRVMLTLLAVAALCLSVVFILPLSGLLRIELPANTLALTIYLLGLQVLSAILFGLVNDTHAIVGRNYRGAMWSNALRLSVFASTALCAFRTTPFSLLAGAQLGTTIAILLLSYQDIRHYAPQASPRLGEWDMNEARRIIPPSLTFGVFTLSNFLVFQAPILVLNRILGPEQVVGFSIARSLFSFARQGLTLIHSTIEYEIRRLYSTRAFDRLGALYLYAESAVVGSATIANLIVFIMAPTLLSLWIRRPELFDYRLFAGMMLISIGMSIKDYKLVFQFATNNHAFAAILGLIGYVAMIILMAPAVRQWGVVGFLVTWAVAEVVQIVAIDRHNRRIYVDTAAFTSGSLKRIGAFLGVLTMLLAAAQSSYPSHSTPLQASLAVLTVCLLFPIVYHQFNIGALITELRTRARSR
jgi:O-antigen/teichoic acid export membrane protein